MVPFFCKVKKEGRDVAIGVEISEGAKFENDPNEMIQAEGRVFMRFFNSSMGKDTHIRFQMEPWEAFDAYTKIQEVARSSVAIKLEMTPHSFTREDVKVVTSVAFEKVGAW